MRKLTGYIGALIIVFALAGSVLAGYALNINGQSAVVNEYESVTDVSGLYSYSDEKAYIDYTPASNYTGYNQITAGEILYSDTATTTYKKIVNDSNITVSGTTGEVWLNGSYTGAITPSSAVGFICDKFITVKNNTYVYIMGYDSNYETAQSEIYITVHGTTTTLSYNGHTYTYTGVKNNLCWYTVNSNFDYYMRSGRNAGNNNDIYAYVNTVEQLVTLSRISPKLNQTTDTSTSETIITSGTTYSAVNQNTGSLSGQRFMFTDITDIPGGAEKVQVNYQPKTSNNWNDGSYSKTISGNSIWYPKQAILSSTSDLGVDYAVSNRVNNYPVVVNPSDTSYQTTQLTLTNISASSVWPVTQYGIQLTDTIIYKKVVTREQTPDRIFSPEWATPDYNNEIQNVNRNYRLSDILNTLSIPSNVKSITIDANSGEYFNVQFGPYPQYGYVGYTARIDKNLAGFTNIDEYQTNETLYYSDIYGEKDYIVYNTETGIASIYDYTGVKKSSNSPDKIAVGFVLNIGNNYTQATGYWWYNDQNYSYGAWNNLSCRTNPYINITYTIVNPGSITYMDITKGISIDSDNIGNVVWDNEYENGNIELLFRAENTNNTYHNDLTISDNEISIDYTDSRYYITLNAGEPVDVGMWRNIILNVDLVNGKLSVIPVRTFNSYTNVQLDKTIISIGDLIGAAPTNTMTWGATNNSLTFNVYSTSVFMNTYGVVMLNPVLNITDYFTELGNFYELKLNNFSIFGDSITVNGETYQVDGNKLTVGNETLIIKDLSIIYADGHAYLEDSHISIDIGEITDNVVSMAGAWYFQTELLKGHTAQKMIYDWDWAGFIFDNTQFCIFYIGLAVAALLIARKFCQLSIIDYAVFIVSVIIALSVQVIA